ncbi:hypothetical protein MA16_Dca019294 [Dendrobium catenatum]|uniref:Uncharacterized protein n=1 Tax=Dendrobium catenatum TaxID=906689 RepID=A0A2I0VJA1_9ASPA|nr:hypothetical protein MA16_Dca019294 [Dendrobium catenatum]
MIATIFGGSNCVDNNKKQLSCCGEDSCLGKSFGAMWMGRFNHSGEMFPMHVLELMRATGSHAKPKQAEDRVCGRQSLADNMCMQTDSRHRTCKTCGIYGAHWRRRTRRKQVWGIRITELGSST